MATVDPEFATQESPGCADQWATIPTRRPGGFTRSLPAVSIGSVPSPSRFGNRFSPPPCRPVSFRLFIGGLVCLLGMSSLKAVSLPELENDPKMTPKRFANQFEGFEYEFFSYVQRPEVFLSSRRGDCDDYALLADRILSRHHFTTRIIRVVLTGRRVNHVVCYVAESKAYLDYNSRNYFLNLDRSGPTLREVAEKVAASFKANWSSASEFTYDYATDKKTIVQTVVKTDPPSRDPDRQPRAAGKN